VEQLPASDGAVSLGAPACPEWDCKGMSCHGDSQAQQCLLHGENFVNMFLSFQLRLLRLPEACHTHINGSRSAFPKHLLSKLKPKNCWFKINQSPQ